MIQFLKLFYNRGDLYTCNTEIVTSESDNEFLSVACGDNICKENVMEYTGENWSNNGNNNDSLQIQTINYGGEVKQSPSNEPQSFDVLKTAIEVLADNSCLNLDSDYKYDGRGGDITIKANNVTIIR